jgi:electron-transferring-flavoprotein dehydrogenase
LNFPGGALIGCSAGFMNVAKIKGTHNAMKSGMLAAEAAYNVVYPTEHRTQELPADMSSYDAALHSSWVREDLYEVRNLRPSFNTRLGIWGGIAYSGVDSLLLKGRVPWTFKHASASAIPDFQVSATLVLFSIHGLSDCHLTNQNGKSLDASHTEPASKHKPIDYPPFEAPLSTDLMTSVSLTGTNHGEDQPVHLRVIQTREFMHEVEEGTEGNNVDRTKERQKEHVEVNVGKYAGLLGQACPAGVYEYVDAEVS